jgi:3D (Asp-Asp-Asp) domain-containing protein
MKLYKLLALIFSGLVMLAVVISTEKTMNISTSTEDMYSRVAAMTITVPTPTTTTPQLVSLGTFKLTAYCGCSNCCGKWANNRPTDKAGNKIVYTATGAVARAQKTISVDKSIIPYGTTVIINGKKYVAQDCGGAIKGKVIDIYFATHQEATKFGVQYTKIYTINKDKD